MSCSMVFWSLHDRYQGKGSTAVKDCGLGGRWSMSRRGRVVLVLYVPSVSGEYFENAF
jgi:hypothetical protein